MRRGTDRSPAQLRLEYTKRLIGIPQSPHSREPVGRRMVIFWHLGSFDLHA